MRGNQAATVKWGVVRHKWQVSDHWFKPFPHLVECRSVVGVGRGKSVYGSVVGKVIIGVGLYEAVLFIDDYSVFDKYNAYKYTTE